ncbi:hypothetical protein BDV23DRAFT_147756 [Aspergillus alliaceus]|uniref:Carrier domain-containing protein n=1 Tax=Petromyces alliaceus TaxID=209559 RepID=A0A5N7CJJ0_PETAA|nr:hypothetical protein BDV23DRAFT_147756 [Aspergillus alliaceus]
MRRKNINRDSLVAHALMYRISKALGLLLENLDSSKAMHLDGVDSLVVVELRILFLSPKQMREWLSAKFWAIQQ